MNSSRTDKKVATKTDDDFLNRWSRRKQQALGEQQQSENKDTQIAIENTETQLPTDADMPPIESLTEDSDYSGFLSPKVSEALRKQALRKLFHGPAFNICDGLDDYDGDYTKFEKLGNIITADMKHQIEMEAQRRMQALADAESLQANENTEDASTLPLDHDSDASEQILADADIEEPIDDDDDAEDNL
jgi:hypothetical protein